MECEQLSDHQEGTAETLLSETPQKEPSVTKTTYVILPLLNRECVDILHVCAVCQKKKALQRVINIDKIPLAALSPSR